VDGPFQDVTLGSFTNFQFESGDNVIVYLRKGETQLDEGFSLAGTLDVPSGRYSTDDWTVGLTTSSARAVSGGFTVNYADFFGGRRRTYRGTLTLAPGPSWSLTASQTRNEVDVSSGSFTADITSLRVNYSFSTQFTTNLLVQYNSLDNAVSANFRLNFIHRPGSDLFLVFTEARGDEDRLWDVQNRGIVTKVTYLWRF
jgi:hypothetical protein